MTDTKQARLPKRSTTIDDLPKVLLSKIAQSVVDRRALRLASKNFSQTLEDLECVDAKELKDMRQSQDPPCKNTARVMYKPDMNMQRAIMCAIMSPDNKLHMYVDQHDLPEFSESVECFDKHYALRLALLYHRDPTTQRYPDAPPPKPVELRCADGFRALKGGLASDGCLQDQRGVQVVQFTGNTLVAERAFERNASLIALLDVNTLKTIGKYAFSGTRLEQLWDMPSLQIIADNAFTYSRRLTRVGDLSSLTQIGNYAFCNTKLKQIGNMKNLKHIGNGAYASGLHAHAYIGRVCTRACAHSGVCAPGRLHTRHTFPNERARSAEQHSRHTCTPNTARCAHFRRT